MIRTLTRELILLKIYEGEHLVFVETSPSADSRAYDRAHIQKAVFLPLPEIETQARKYLPNLAAMIVVYGQDSSDPSVPQAAQALQALGYGNVNVFPSGKAQWLAETLPIETIPSQVKLEKPEVLSAAPKIAPAKAPAA